MGIDLWRAFVVYARWTATEDQGGRVSVLQLVPGCVAGYELAVNVGLAHTARDQLAELRAEVEDEYRLLTREGVDLVPPGRGGLVQLLPIPTCCACWNTFPSETIDGAITISTCWNSAMSRAPQTPNAE